MSKILRTDFAEATYGKTNGPCRTEPENHTPTGLKSNPERKRVRPCSGLAGASKSQKEGEHGNRNGRHGSESGAGGKTMTVFLLFHVLFRKKIQVLIVTRTINENFRMSSFF